MAEAEPCGFGHATRCLTDLADLAPQADLIFHAAALSDFTVQSSPTKLTSHQSHTLTLTPGPKLLPSLRAWAPHGFLCAWKLANAETAFCSDGCCGDGPATAGCLMGDD